MDQLLQALVMGVVQGLTEFLPISSSGHLILVPYLLGWDDDRSSSRSRSPSCSTRARWRRCSSTSAADWLRLIPAFFASLRDRSLGDDPDRRLAWLLVLSTLPAAVDRVPAQRPRRERRSRQPGLVAVMLVVGAAILWLADRWGPRTHTIDRLTARGAVGIGLAQALALVPGVSRSGHLDVRRACSPASTAPTPPATAS